MIRLYFILITSLIFNCQALEFSIQESHVLEKFFRTMIENSEGGYVIYDKKPVCIVGFHTEDFFINENERHRESVCLREGASLLKKAALMSFSDNILVHVYNQRDSSVKNTTHILFINKSLFLDTVRSNLPLFQYVLGPKITPEKLLDKLIDPKETFYNVMKNDKVLIGIVLGFGTQNALYGSRVENVENELLASELVPFKNQLSKVEGIRAEFLRSILLRSSKTLQTTKVTPSFSFNSLAEEMQSLMSEMDVASIKLAKNNPSFVFGRLKHDKETEVFVEELERSQSKINVLLSEENFLEQVLKIIYPREKIVVNLFGNSEQTFEKAEAENLPLLVAANIWDLLDGEENIYQDAFIMGMQDAEKKLSADKKINYSKFQEYEKLGAYVKIKENLAKTNEYFKSLSQDSSMHCLIPANLYYSVIQNGSGLIFNNENRVFVHYSIKTPDDQILADTWMRNEPVKLNLSDTIPGFAHGLNGMKIGEIRKIFIHPSLAYGIYTTLDKGIYLTALVQLLSFTNDKEVGPFPELKSLDLNVEVSPTIESDYFDLKKEVAYNQGYHLWQHYKKNNLYTLPQILEKFAQFQSGENADISSEESQDLINRLHWNLYL